MKTDQLENQALNEIKRLCVKYGISPIELSFHIRVTKVRIYEILSGKRRVTPDTDIRLCRFFGLETGHFAAKQLKYDLEIAERNLAERKLNIIPVSRTVRF